MKTLTLILVDLKTNKCIITNRIQLDPKCSHVPLDGTSANQVKLDWR
jgi:hypothetical protein